MAKKSNADSRVLRELLDTAKSLKPYKLVSTRTLRRMQTLLLSQGISTRNPAKTPIQSCEITVELDKN